MGPNERLTGREFWSYMDGQWYKEGVPVELPRGFRKWKWTLIRRLARSLGADGYSWWGHAGERARYLVFRLK